MSALFTTASIAADASFIFRDFTTDGVPSSLGWDPNKSDIRSWGGAVGNAINQLYGIAGSGALGYATLSALNADLAHAANTVASVFSDGSNNGIYFKSGASGSGSWSRVSTSLYGLLPTWTISGVSVASGGPAAVTVGGTPAAPSLSLTIPYVNFTVGTTSTLAGGASASLVIGGSSLSPTLNFGVPAGLTPNISIGAVSTVAYGSSPTVTISGTAANPSLSFGLPSGPSGALTWRGAWSSGGTYHLNDLVSNAGSVYIGNTASPTGTPGSSGSWDLFVTPTAGPLGGDLAGTLPSPTLTPIGVERRRLPRNPLAQVHSNTGVEPRSLVIIGNSIAASSVLGYASGWVNLLAKKISRMQPLPIASQVSFADPEYLALSAGVSYGTTGPLGKSLLIPSGERVQFYSDNADFIKLWYQEYATTATITVTNNQNSTTDSYTTTAGSTANAALGFVNNHRTGKNALFTIANTSGSGSHIFELNGVGVYHYTGSIGILPQVFAYPAYTSADFTATLVLNAIGSQIVYPTHPTLLIDLVTNDIWSARYVSSATCVANHTAIANWFMAAYPTGNVVINLPMLPYGSSATLFGTEPAENYYAALYAYAASQGFKVIDLSLLNMNFNPGQLYQDNLHPSALGNQVLADYIFAELGLANYEPNDIVLPITPINGFSAVGGYSPPTCVVRRGRAYLSGTLNNPGSAPTLPVTLGTFDSPTAGPPTIKQFGVPMNGGTPGLGIVNIDKSGAIALENYVSSGGWPGFISLEGVNFPIDL